MAQYKQRISYLLLDKDDITKQCGSMTTRELSKALGIEGGTNIKQWLNRNGILEGKYVVVENQ